MDYDALMTSLLAEMDQLGLRQEGGTPGDSVAELAALLGWLRPQLPVLADVVAQQNETFALSLNLAGINVPADDLLHHTLAVTFVVLARLVRAGALVLPPC